MAPVSLLKSSLARGIGSASRASGRGGGTSLPGKVLLKLDPRAIGEMSRQLELGSCVISATNGKTTTSSLLAGIFRSAGISIVHNHAGANMAGGIATALLDDLKRGRPQAQFGLFEVDEAWVAQIVAESRPRVVLLANLFRDQLDRYGELESIVDSWAEMVAALPSETRLVVNADDPLLAGLAADRPNTLYFGLEDTSHAEAAPRHAADSKFCRRCGSPLDYEAVQLGHLGKYSCPNGDFARPTPHVAAREIVSHGMDGSSVAIATSSGTIEFDLPIPGLYNVYNAVAAVAAASALDIPSDSIAGGLASARAVFGRVERMQIGTRDVALLLIKNPTGANEVLRTITESGDAFDLWIALNDKIADGRDVSWIWDADFEMLAGHVRRVTCSGTRAEEIALRLAYAGVERERIVIDHQIESSFDQAAVSGSDESLPLFALPTYTSLLELRTALARRGDAAEYWSTSK